MKPTGPSVVGDVEEMTIERMGQAGDGVGRIADGRLAFIPGALPGERVRAEITDERRNFVRAALLNRQTTSPDRVRPPCPVVDRCGGCVFQHWDYQAELAYKEQRVRRALTGVGLDFQVVRPIRGAADAYGYRNKGQFPIGRESGRVVVGLYRRGTHEVIPITACAIQDPFINTILPQAAALLDESGIEVWDEAHGTGTLRHLLIRSSGWEKRALVLLVAARWDSRIRTWAQRLMARHPYIAGVAVNLNAASGNRVLGPETRLIVGEDAIQEKILGLSFRLSFTSFFQVNPAQAATLYETAMGFLPNDDGREVWDLYAGVGTLAALAASRAKRVRALEVHPDAVKDARTNMAINHLHNVVMDVGRVEMTINHWVDQGGDPPGAVIVDPPRAGMDPRVIEQLKRLGPQRIVYVSCNPETWARDLERLRPHYAVRQAVPVDLFPQTDHVEIASWLERRQEGDGAAQNLE